MSIPRTPVAATLTDVDARLRACLSRLHDDWYALTQRPSDILVDDDLPRLIGQAALGGKRFRPAMVHWGWVAARGGPDSYDDVVTAGAALELLHVFALIHDDVMDQSAMRRGKPSTHQVASRAHVRHDGHGDPTEFGHNIAVLAGDLAHAEAMHLALTLPAPVHEVWRSMMLELVLGQRRDLTGAALGRRDMGHALEVAKMKTGSYSVERPLEMGALLGQASPEALQCLRTYGVAMGEAFGLRDDVLGMWGDEGETGKPVGDDLALGKATVVLALAAERLSPEGRHLLSLTGTKHLSDMDLDDLRAEIDACGVRDDVEQMIADFVEQAFDALDPAHLTDAGIAGLRQIGTNIAWRAT